jgi:hypothetical protein
LIVGQWIAKLKGYQATFLIPANLQAALLQAPEDGQATLIGEFSKPPTSNSAIVSTNKITTYFGLGNLRNSLQALLNR